MNNVTYISTKNLDAMILNYGRDMKLQIFNSYHSPYGYDKRDLIEVILSFIYLCKQNKNGLNPIPKKFE